MKQPQKLLASKLIQIASEKLTRFEGLYFFTEMVILKTLILSMFSEQLDNQYSSAKQIQTHKSYEIHFRTEKLPIQC